MRSSNQLKLFEFTICGKAFGPGQQWNQLILGRIFAQFGQLLKQEQQVTKGIAPIPELTDRKKSRKLESKGAHVMEQKK